MLADKGLPLRHHRPLPLPWACGSGGRMGQGLHFPSGLGHIPSGLGVSDTPLGERCFVWVGSVSCLPSGLATHRPGKLTLLAGIPSCASAGRGSCALQGPG